jgi:mRNA interferase YafQ
MREIFRTDQFKKDFKRLRSSGRDVSKLVGIIEALQRDEPLSPIHRDHALTGNWQEWRECHLGGDWLLIYKTTARELVLARTGSHSELFE